MRAVFGIACMFCWLLVVVLTLELVVECQFLPVAWSNRYYLATHGDMSVRWPEVSRAPEALLKADPPPLSCEAMVSRTPAAADWEVLQRLEDRAQREARRGKFPTLPEADRIWFALGNGETVLQFGTGGELEAVYDDAFKQCLVRHLWQTFPSGDVICEQVREVARTLKPTWVSINVDPAGSPVGQTDFLFLPDPEGKCVYAFFDWEYRRLKIEGPEIPANSRWDVWDYSYKKNFREAVLADTYFSTNQQGFRSPDVAVPKPEGVFRILCIGGSTTYEGPDNAHTYPALLEKKLRETFPSKRIEVVNCGVQGMRTRSQFLHMPDYFELEPDLVIGYLGVNDIQHDVQDVFIVTAPAWVKLLTVSKFVRYNFGRFFWPDDDDIRCLLKNLTITNIEGLRRIFAREGIRFAVCSLSYAPYDTCTREQRRFYDTTCNVSAGFFAKLALLLNEEIRGYCEKNNVFYIPVAENITDSNYLIDTCHLSDAGIALKADIVFLSIRDCVSSCLEGKN